MSLTPFGSSTAPRPTIEISNKLKQSVRRIRIVNQKQEEQHKQVQTETTDVKKDITFPLYGEYI